MVAGACTPADGLHERTIDAGLVSAIAELRGTCATARPMGEQTNYRHVIALRGEGGGIAVRSDPSWSTDRRNVIGELDRPQRVAAFGPVKAIPSQGIGWIVPLYDPEGATCRGYVSATVAEPIACDVLDDPIVSFPDPFDGSAGACTPR